LGYFSAGPEVAKQMVDVYLSTHWEGQTNERHANRVVGSLLFFSPSPTVYDVAFASELCHLNFIFHIQKKIHALENQSD
jgi:hypothetical protein